MAEHIVKILAIEFETHDVRRIIIEKPKGYKFVPGQYADVAVNHPDWTLETRPFTFTCLPSDGILEFNMKGYYDHDGVTKKIHSLKAGDELIITDPTGTIEYKGQGVFIAGGAGITPFIAILRNLANEGRIKGNSLIFSNKTQSDIILEKEFKSMLGNKCIFTLTHEKKEGYENRMVDETFLKEKIKDFSQHFYVCGPSAMVESVQKALEKLGAKSDAVVFEK